MYHNRIAMNYTLTPEVSEAISYVISNAIESGWGRSWFNHRNYDWEDKKEGFYAEAEFKMDDGCDPNWSADWIKVTPQVFFDRAIVIMSMPDLGIHKDNFMGTPHGLAHEMHKVLVGDYGDGDAIRDDALLQALFCGEVVCG